MKSTKRFFSLLYNERNNKLMRRISWIGRRIVSENLSSHGTTSDIRTTSDIIRAYSCGGNVEKTIQRSSAARDIQRDHFINKQRIKAYECPQAVPTHFRPMSRELEELYVKQYKAEIIAYAADCNGHKFNCHSYTLTDGKCGFISPEDFQKVLNDPRCKLIGTSDSLHIPIQQDDVIVWRKKPEAIYNESLMANAGSRFDPQQRQKFWQEALSSHEKGTFILHSGFFHESGGAYPIESSWGPLGIYRHGYKKILSEFESYVEIYRITGGRLNILTT